MLTSTISPTGGVTIIVRPAIFGHFCDECIGRCYGQCLLIVWQMLLPIMFGIMSPVRCYKLVISGVVVTTVGILAITLANTITTNCGNNISHTWQ